MPTYDDRRIHRAMTAMGQEPGFALPAKRKKPSYEESHIQQALVRWFDGVAREHNIDPEYLMAFPLQGHRSAANGARMKAEGMRKGTLDLHLAIPRGQYHALWIELKTATGKLSPSQREMIARLRTQGYAAGGAWGLDDAKRYILAYLRGVDFIFP